MPTDSHATAAAESAATENAEDTDEEIIAANSPLGRYAAEVGLADAVTLSSPSLDAEWSNSLPDAFEDNNDASRAAGVNEGDLPCTGFHGRLIKLVISKAVTDNVALLRGLLDDDDMRHLVLTLTDDSKPHKSKLLNSALLFALTLLAVVLVYWVGSVYAALIVLTASCLAFVPWLGAWSISRWLALFLSDIERCLATQRACLRLARERLQVERGYTLIRGNASSVDKEAAMASPSRRAAPALNRAAFESARRLTYSMRRLARSVQLGGLATVTDDAEFGEAFNLAATAAELVRATDSFAPTALASMAALLQMHLSDIVLRLLLASVRCCCIDSPYRWRDLIRIVFNLRKDIAAEAHALESRLERHRRREVTDVDSLLEEFLGGSEHALPKSPMKNDSPTKPKTPIHSAAHSLRLQAEALLVKAALIERQTAGPSASTLSSEIADLALEARVCAINAAACCDEIETAVKPPAPPSASMEPAAVDVKANESRPVVHIDPDTAPIVEDEFLEGLVSADNLDGQDDGRDADAADLDEAARRAATRRVLGELDSVILQRRRLFQQREEAARAKLGLPPAVPADGEEDSKDQPVKSASISGEASPKIRRRRRIVWHGTLEGDGDGGQGDVGSGTAAPPSKLSLFAASSSTFAAAALAARQQRGIRLSEEAFGDSDGNDDV